MLVDRAFRFVFRNFSTLWLIVATIVFPLHLAHGFAYRDVIAVRELHGAIERFPAYLQVKGVSAARLSAARTSYAALTAVEIALVPLLAAATARVLEEDARGGVPGALRSWGGLRRLRLRAQFRRPGPVMGAVAVSVAIGWLLETMGGLLLEPVPEGLQWVGGALVAGAARSLALPFTTGTLALSALQDEALST